MKNKNLEQVDLVDKLMSCYRNGVEPSKEDKLRAYELKIDVETLEHYVKEVELEQSGQED